MKNIFCTFLALFSFLLSHTQQLKNKELNTMSGYWVGKLTYKDYSTGKPFSMQANLQIQFSANILLMGYEYPKEPHANSTDTFLVTGKFFGKEKITAFKQLPGGGFKMETEIKGVDGNDHQQAILRHTYLQFADSFTIRKEVKFDGTESWIERNSYQFAKAQKEQHMLRIAKIKVDPAQLSLFKLALNEQMNAAIAVEPGVLSYYAVSDKKDPCSITIFETYADSKAYLSHIQTNHFKEYKETVKNMVLSLELEDVELVCEAKKIK